MTKDEIKKYETLYFLGKDTSGNRFDDYEEFVKKEFSGWIPPHVDDALEKANTVDEFLHMLEVLDITEGSEPIKKYDGVVKNIPYTKAISVLNRYYKKLDDHAILKTNSPDHIYIRVEGAKNVLDEFFKELKAIQDETVAKLTEDINKDFIAPGDSVIVNAGKYKDAKGTVKRYTKDVNAYDVDIDGKLATIFPNDIRLAESLQYGHLGNGIVVWDNSIADPDTKDYKKIAHIDGNRKVKYYVDVTPDQKREIEYFAKTSNPTISATQNDPVFNEQLNEAINIPKLIADYNNFSDIYSKKKYSTSDWKVAMADKYVTELETMFKTYNNEIVDLATDAMFYNKPITEDKINKLQTYLDTTYKSKANNVEFALRKILDSSTRILDSIPLEDTDKLKFRSHTNHNPDVDILEYMVTPDTSVSYGEYVTNTNKHVIGDSFMEFYTGPNYHPTKNNSNKKSYSRYWDSTNIPKKYKPLWNKLKKIYVKKYKG